MVHCSFVKLSVSLCRLGRNGPLEKTFHVFYRGSDTLDGTCEATAKQVEHTDDVIGEYVQVIPAMPRLVLDCGASYRRNSRGTQFMYTRLEKLSSADRSAPSETKKQTALQKNNVPCEHTIRTTLDHTRAG